MACLEHDPEHLTCQVRREALCRHLEAYGAHVESFLFGPADYEAARVTKASRRQKYAILLDRMLEKGRDWDAVYVPTDATAALVHTLLRERGIAPERDIVTISCNNEKEWLETLHPQPATVDVQPYEQGREAVRRLAWRLENRLATPTTTLIAPKLVLGETAS